MREKTTHPVSHISRQPEREKHVDEYLMKKLTNEDIFLFQEELFLTKS